MKFLTITVIKIKTKIKITNEQISKFHMEQVKIFPQNPLEMTMIYHLWKYYEHLNALRSPNARNLKFNYFRAILPSLDFGNFYVNRNLFSIRLIDTFF